MLLEASHVTTSFGAQDVLRDVSFRLTDGERVGLVGKNGIGKTTLLRILASEAPPDRGHVRRVPSTLSLGYLPQATHDDRRRTVRDRFAAIGVDEARWWEAAQVLAGLGFAPAQWDQPVASLSGGEKTRLSLATLLVSRPEILLLDEPTNHLDIAMLEWLEAWVNRFPGAALIVSHDRRFLDATVTRIVELADGALTSYTGDYSDYARQKDLALRQQAEAYRERQREQRSIEEFIGRQMRLAAHIQSGPKRGRDFHGRVAKKVAKRAQAGRKRLEQMERVEKPRTAPEIHARFDRAETSGQVVLTAERIAKRYGERPLFADLSLSVRSGDRLAIVGRNGAGKTTLLRVLLGREHPDAGTVVRGARIVAGYLAQEHEDLDLQRSVLDEVASAGGASQTEVRTLLACLLFGGDRVFRRVGQLSEGERVRVALAKLLVSGANLLVLDEPTNHLDIATRERIETALDAFAGTVLLVSHDRHLLDRLAERTLVIEDGATTLYEGNYSYAEEKRRAELPISSLSSTSPGSGSRCSPPAPRTHRIRSPGRRSRRPRAGSGPRSPGARRSSS
jgi:ATPase subunit of ABC transporter with duplicated ATPase domains